MAASSTSSQPIRLAILHQSLAPPAINGVSKPPKPGGYKDSGADIGYALSQPYVHSEKHEACVSSSPIVLITPVEKPRPDCQDDWTFPEDETGLEQVLRRGATHIWANVHTYRSHPLQISTLPGLEQVEVVGQPPRLAQWADDKGWFNEYLRSRAQELDLALPEAVLIRRREGTVSAQLDAALRKLGLPIIVKPPRGRGSSGVKCCGSVAELQGHVEMLMGGGDIALLEEYLAGEEGSIGVMPPAPDEQVGRYMALPFVQRYDQIEGVMPDSGGTAVSLNSRALSLKEIENDTSYRDAMRQCEVIGELLKATAPIRVDVRRGVNGRFRVFDVNLKPVSAV